MVGIRQRSPVKPRDKRNKFEILLRPARRRRELANHPEGLFVIRLALLEPADFLKQRGRLQKEAFFNRCVLSNQGAIRQAVVKLQGKARDPANASERE